jgi:hypothetical protein
MAYGLKDLPTDQPTSTTRVIRADVQGSHQEGPILSQPTSINTTTIPGQESSLTSRILGFWSASAIRAWIASILHAFNVVETGGDKAILRRRICMNGILLTETVNATITLWKYAHRGEYEVFVLGVILVPIGLIVMANWLAKIGELSGKRKAFGKVVRRKHYDVFLGCMFLLQLTTFTGVFAIPPEGSMVVWIWMMWWAARIARNPPVEDEPVV